VIVVTNASPLISLGAVGQLELLHQLFGEISVPQAVFDEVRSVNLRAEDWLVSRKVEKDFVSRALEGELDRGESEAIALAVELQAGLLLMDERRGRKVALRFNLRVLGTLGVLIEAKRSGLLPEIKPVLSDLQAKAGFRTSSALYQRVLDVAGEV
jgi:predicted nucleic acid-binding protein